MQIPFRQGIVRRPTVLTGPDWLQKTSLSGASIDLNIGTESTIISFAHYDSNYTFDEDKTIVGAWGGGAVGSINGPMVAVGQSQWLFWDVDLGTGSLTRGWTVVPPINSYHEPVNPVDDMHWFDLQNMVMKVYKAAGGYWINKVRLFAAQYDASGTILPYALGSQINVNNGIFHTGNIILGKNNKPLKQAEGTFVTTESDLIIYQTSGQNVRFDMALMFAMAAEELPKYYLVKFLPNNRVGLASNLDTLNFARGMVIADHHQEEMAQVVSSGYIRNEQWNWPDSSINKPIFCGVNGEIMLTSPTVGVSHIVGHIVDKTSIYLNFQSPIRLR